MGCHFLLQGIFPTQRSNLCLLHWQADSLPLSYLASPKFFIYFGSSRSKLRHVESVLLIWNNYRWWIYATYVNICTSDIQTVVKTLFFHIKNLYHHSAPGTCNQKIREALKLKPKARGWTKCLIVNLALSSQLQKSACYSYVELNSSKKNKGAHQDSNDSSIWVKLWNHMLQML